MAPGVRAAVEAADVSFCTSSLLIRRGDKNALLGDFFLRTGPSLDGTLCLASGRSLPRCGCAEPHERPQGESSRSLVEDS
jgi:hypothetical protein